MTTSPIPVPAHLALPTYLIPDKIQEQLIAWGDRRKRDNRWIGQITLYIFARIQEEGTHCPRMDMYKAIGQLANGAAARTIRYHARLAEYYPDPIWEEFDVLPYSHFNYAAQYPDLTRIILETAVEQMDHNGGKPPTVEWLRWRFGEEITQTAAQLEAEQPDPQDTVTDLDPFGDGFLLPEPDSSLTPGATRRVLGHLLDTARRARDLMPSEPLRDALGGLVSRIEEIAHEVAT